MKSIGSYEEIERKHELITRLFYYIPILTCVVVFTLTAMQPILYMVFEFPRPEQWQLPIQAQYVSVLSFDWISKMRSNSMIFFAFDQCSQPVSIDTVLGFYTGLILQIISARLQIVTYTTAISFNLGVCMYFNGLIEHLYEQFAHLTEELHMKRVDFTKIPSKLIEQSNFHSAILTYEKEPQKFTLTLSF